MIDVLPTPWSPRKTNLYFDIAVVTGTGAGGGTGDSAVAMMGVWRIREGSQGGEDTRRSNKGVWK